MPRTSKIKSAEAMYHIMARSISEIDLFKYDEDKEYYISLIKKYSDKHKCSIYAYNIMDNHMHLFINPRGFDISVFMHCLNSAYVAYFNRKYNRHGHLFQGRFASTIVDSDVYALTLSAYIHNNPKDIEGYNGREHTYPYSSYGIYLGIRKDYHNLVEKDFVLEQFSADAKKAAVQYHKFAVSMNETGIWNKVDKDIVLAYTKNEYRSEKKSIARDLKPEAVIQKVFEVIEDETRESLKNKYSRKSVNIRAFVTYAMRVLCGYNFRQICDYIGNMTMSGITRLSMKGFLLTAQQDKYRKAFDIILGMT